MIDIDELKRLAMATKNWPSMDDGKFIAAAKPSIILELIERLEQAEESLRIAKDVGDGIW